MDELSRGQILLLDHEKSIESLQDIPEDEFGVQFNHGSLLLLRQVLEDFEVLLRLEEVVLVVFPFVFEEIGNVVHYWLL